MEMFILVLQAGPPAKFYSTKTKTSKSTITMEHEEPLVLEGMNPTVRRRQLLPTWIKVFIWIFMLLGALTPFILVMAILGIKGELSLYGLETSDPYSVTGLIITALFAIKGIAAFGLWMEKDWAINLAIIDAITGIVVCSLVILAPLFSASPSFSFRLELALLIPYLIKLQKIRRMW
jgi:hypothetical protein